MNSNFSHETSTNSLTISQHTGIVRSDFSPLWAAVSPAGIRYFSFGISREQFLEWTAIREKHTKLTFSLQPDPVFDQVIAYLTGQRRMFSIPIDDQGWTGFQKSVYQVVMEIPYGQTKTYGEIAQKLGKPHAARAVGAANGTNPLPIIIPCHRLVGADGSLRGYGGKGGLATKRWLLDLEQRASNHRQE